MASPCIVSPCTSHGVIYSLTSSQLGLPTLPASSLHIGTPDCEEVIVHVQICTGQSCLRLGDLSAKRCLFAHGVQCFPFLAPMKQLSFLSRFRSRTFSLHQRRGNCTFRFGVSSCQDQDMYVTSYTWIVTTTKKHNFTNCTQGGM